MRILEPFLPDMSNPIVVGDWDYLKRSLNSNLKTVQTYYHKTPFEVRNGHILSKIINSVGIDFSLDLSRVFNHTKLMQASLCRAFGITSSFNQGGLLQNVFYPECHEILMLDDTEVDFERAIKVWYKLEPIKVLSHPFNDVNFYLPYVDGARPTPKNQVAVLSINIQLLIVQYVGWLRWQGEVGARNIKAFIHMFPLCNAIRTGAEISLINRWFEMPTIKRTKVHPFALPDYNGILEKYVKKRMELLSKEALTIRGVYLNLPAITQHNAAAVLAIRHLNVSKQNRWAWFTAYRSYLVNARLINSVSDKYQNPETTKWPKDLKLLLNEFSVNTGNPDFQYYFKTSIENLMEL